MRVYDDDGDDYADVVRERVRVWCLRQHRERVYVCGNSNQ